MSVHHRPRGLFSPPSPPFHASLRDVNAPPEPALLPAGALSVPLTAPPGTNGRTDSCPNGEARHALPLFHATLLQYEGSAAHPMQDAADADPMRGIAAVADGVTQSAWPEELARALVREFVSGMDGPCADDPVRECWQQVRMAWWRAVTPRVAHAHWALRRRFAEGGARTTFLGFRLVQTPAAAPGWEFWSVGDCAAYWFREEVHLVARFPEAECLNNHPPVLQTLQAASDLPPIECSRGAGPLPGSLLVLATDRIAEFLDQIRPWEQEPGFWREREAEGHTGFGAWCRQRQEQGQLGDDDYTLLLLRFPAPACEGT